MSTPREYSERPDVAVTLPYWVASALFKAAASGMGSADDPEEAERMRLGTVALGKAMQAARDGYQ